MIGTSYNGTLPLAAATTGVDGLEAIVPIAPNTSYYHYYRSNGLVRSPGGYLGEDADVLFDFIHSGHPDKRDYCNEKVRDEVLLANLDRVTGDYSDFWAGRDYLNDLGPMKAAERRAQETGVTVPPEAKHIEQANKAIRPKEGVKPRVMMFVLPMLALVFFTLWFDKDFLKGIYVTLGGTVAVILLTRILDMHDTFDTVIDGFKTMIEPLGVLVAAFVLNDINTQLQLSEYVVATMQPLLTAELLPVMIFSTMGLVSFMTGSNWGVFVIILPIVTTLANNLEADMTLVIGATLSASTFGSHACFYSDATVLRRPRAPPSSRSKPARRLTPRRWRPSAGRLTAMARSTTGRRAPSRAQRTLRGSGTATRPT